MPSLRRITTAGPFCLLISALWANGLAAQDNPFGDGPDNPFGAAPAEAAPSLPTLVEEENPLVRQLLERVGGGPIERAKIIASLARIGRWPEVDRVLSGTDLAGLDGTTQARMAAEIGPDLYIRIQQNDEVSDDAKKILRQLGEAASRQNESPEQLRQAISQLVSPSVDDRLAASRRLLAGGNTAIAELASAAVSTDERRLRDTILQILLRFGDEGIEPLRQLQLYGTPEVRLGALESLGRISRKRHLPLILSALHSADSTANERAVAKRLLSYDNKSIPTASDALEILEADFRDKQREANRTDNDDQREQIWLVADGSSVEPQTTYRMIAKYRDFVDAATRLRRLGDLPPQLRRDVFTADLTYRVLVDPDWGDPEQIDSLRATYPKETSPQDLSNVLRRALEQEELVASIGVLRMIRALDTGPAERSLLLSGSAGKPSPLVDAANHPEPQVRYEAALAVAQLSGKSPYAGSSVVMRTLSEMASLPDRPTVLVLETRPAVVLQLERLLTDLGFEARIVPSVADLQRAIAQGGDLRMLLSKTDLPDRMAIEMIDLVRRMPRGGRLPIVFYGEQEIPLSWKRWSAPTIQIDRPASVAGLDGILDQISRRGRLPALSIVDRQLYQQAAAERLQQQLGGS